MKISLINYIPLSNAVIAGRTAWQSFHKGGNYKYATDNITVEDYNFLNRLFNKLKHISVAEHIWYTFKISFVDSKEKDLLCKIKNEYNFFSEIDENNYIFSVNLRTILEELLNRYVGQREIRDFYLSLINILPHIHQNLIRSEDFVEGEDKNILEFKTFKNNIGHKVQKFYYYNVKENINFERRPHKFVSFRISGFSRALLQELVRHDDLLAITVKSTRYTLKELKNEKPFIKGIFNKKLDIERAKNYIIILENMDYNFIKKQIIELENLRQELKKGIPNDKVKYLLPESYRTESFLTFNVLNIENLLKLRLDKSALWEFQELSKILKKSYYE